MRAAVAAVAISVFFAVGTMYGGSCEAADTLLSGMHYDEAQKLYVAILKKDRNEQCAREGLVKIAAARAEAGRHLDLAALYESAADKDAAKRESLEAARLGILPRSQPSPSGTAKADPFAAARWLAAAGLHDVALEKLKTAADTTPPEKTLPAELRYLTGPRIYHMVRRHEEATFVLLLVLTALVVAGLRRILHPRLIMDNLEDPSGVIAGRGAALYLQQQLISLTRLQSSGRIRFVTSPLTQVTVPAAISTAIPTTLGWIKPVLSLLSAIDWRRSLTLGGCVHPPVDEKGVGLTLILSRSKTIISTTTLWQREFGTIPLRPPPAPDPAGMTAPADLSPYLDLVQPAAIWLLFQLFQLRRTAGAEIRRVMGTAQWASYALNAVAARGAHKSPKRAQEMLIRGISIDPDNAAAHANLGLILQESATEERQLRTALDQLKIARKKQRSENGIADPVFFTASYFTAYTHYALYALTQSQEELKNAFHELENLVRVMRDLKVSATSDQMRNFISGTLPTVDVMRIGVEAETGAITPAEAHLQLLAHLDHSTDETQYNLACTYSVLARLSQGAERLCFLNDALEHLAFALHLQPDHAKAAESDPSLAAVRSMRSTEFNTLIAAGKKAAAPPAAAETVSPDTRPALPPAVPVAAVPSLVKGVPAGVG